MEAVGAADEAQAAVGVARAACDDAELGRILTEAEGDLWVLMAELATAPENRHKLVVGKTAVGEEMVSRLEGWIDAFSARTDPPRGFVLPGANPTSAALDLARAVVRRAERRAFALYAAEATAGEGSRAPVYLNRLSDLCWVLARWLEGPSHPMASGVRPAEGAGDAG